MIKNKRHSEITLEINKYKAEATKLIKQISEMKQGLAQCVNPRDISFISYFKVNLPKSRALLNEISHKLFELKKERRKLQHNFGIKKRDADLAERNLKFIDWQKTYNVDEHKKDIMEYRMYSMVLRQLNPMQKGVQSLHAVVEYSRNFGWFESSIYNKWADCDKTMIILDAGVSTDLNDAMMKLDELNISYASFKEPDLYDMTTAIAFLADECVWNTKEYPDYNAYSTDKTTSSVENNALFVLPPTEEQWAQDVFNTTVDVANNIINFRQFIFSKKLSQ